MKLALISCTKSKHDYPCKAKEMYTKSTLFQKVVNFVETKNYNDWYVISAKYGLLSKDTLIDPYDVTLYSMKANERKSWASTVAEQVIQLNPDSIDIYAGERYRQYLVPFLQQKGITCSVPLKGMQIGEQLSYLGKHEKRV